MSIINVLQTSCIDVLLIVFENSFMIYNKVEFFKKLILNKKSTKEIASFYKVIFKINKCFLQHTFGFNQSW